MTSARQPPRVTCAPADMPQQSTAAKCGRLASAFAKHIDVDALVTTAGVVSDDTALEPYVVRVASMRMALQHARLVLSILDPFQQSIAQHLEQSKGTLLRMVGAVDEALAASATWPSASLADFGWPGGTIKDGLQAVLDVHCPDVALLGRQVSCLRTAIQTAADRDYIGMAVEVLQRSPALAALEQAVKAAVAATQALRGSFQRLWEFVEEVAAPVAPLLDAVKVRAMDLSAKAEAASAVFTDVTVQAHAILDAQVATAKAAAESATEAAAAALDQARRTAGRLWELEKEAALQAAAVAEAEIEAWGAAAVAQARAAFDAAAEVAEEAFAVAVRQVDGVETQAVQAATDLLARATAIPNEQIAVARQRMCELVQTVEASSGAMAEAARLGVQQLQRVTLDPLEQVLRVFLPLHLRFGLWVGWSCHV